MDLLDGQYYDGVWESFDTVKLGKNGTPAFEVTLRMEDGKHRQSTIWINSSKGRDYLFNRLKEFGCDSDKLTGLGWREHIQETMKGRVVQAKAEEYNGYVNLKGLYVKGGDGGTGRGVSVQLAQSPFATDGGGGVDDETVPF